MSQIQIQYYLRKCQDKLRDELLKLKLDYKAKAKDYNNLRVDMIRLEVIKRFTAQEENKKNNRIIEEFINEATKFSPEINKLLRPLDENNNEAKQEFDMNNECLNDNFISNFNNNNPNKLSFTHINPSNIIRLREVVIF